MCQRFLRMANNTVFLGQADRLLSRNLSNQMNAHLNLHFHLFCSKTFCEVFVYQKSFYYILFHFKNMHLKCLKICCWYVTYLTRSGIIIGQALGTNLIQLADTRAVHNGNVEVLQVDDETFLYFKHTLLQHIICLLLGNVGMPVAIEYAGAEHATVSMACII